MHFLHPQVGDLNLDREKMHLSQTDGVMLVIFHHVAAQPTQTNWPSWAPQPQRPTTGSNSRLNCGDMILMAR